MKTQRAFLTAVAKQTLVPANIGKIPGFIDIAKKYVETNMDFNSVKDYVPYAIDFNMDNLKSDKLPGTPELTNGVWVYTVDKKEAKKVINKLFYQQEEETSIDNNSTSSNKTSSPEDSSQKSETQNTKKSSLNIEVLNGSGSSKNFSYIVSELKNYGYTVSKTGKTTPTNKTVIINRQDISDNIKEDLKDILNTDNITKGQSSGNTDVTIIIGTDYTKNK